MEKPTFVSSSNEPHTNIPLSKLGPVGSTGILSITAEFDDDRFAGRNRHADRSTRTFSCKALLSENSTDTRSINGAFEKSDGSTHLVMPPTGDALELTTPLTTIILHANEREEVSMATADIAAESAQQAREIFEDQLTPYLDSLSYAHQVPIHIALIVTNDQKNEIQYVSFKSPPRPSVIKEGEFKIAERMRPIYALYRECQNAPSPYHKILSLFKIMEGLLNPLRTEVLRELRKQGKTPKIPKLVVPDSPGIANGLKEHIGKPIGVLVNGFLTKQYRDAIAHFELRHRPPMDIGSAEESYKAIEVAFLTDLCARVLIDAHEDLLSLLDTEKQ